VADNAPAGGGTPGLDMEALSKMINDTVSKAVGERLNRNTLDKLVGEKITAALGGESIGKAVEAAIAKMVEETPAETPSNGATQPASNPAGKGNGATQQPQDDPRLAEMMKRIADAEKRVAAAEKAAAEKDKAMAAQAAAAKQQKLLAHTRAELAKMIGNDAQAEALAERLVEKRKWIDESPDGAIVWGVQDGEGGIKPVPFHEGLKAWAGTDEGKSWIPVRPQQVRMPLAGMPFPTDPSGVHPAAFGSRNGSQQPVGNPVLAAMAQDLAGSDAQFASHMMAHAAFIPPDTKK